MMSKAMIELLNSRPVLFGLRQQGKLELVHEMVQAGASWEEIGKEIGWSPEAVERFYGFEKEGGQAETPI